MSASLRGKTIAFSGTFANKSEAIAKAIRAGAIVSPTMSKKIDFLIKADPKAPTGMKEVVAKYNGTKILPATSFLNFVQRSGAKKVAAASAASSAKGRIRTIATPSAARKTAAVKPIAQAADEESSGPMPWMKGSKFNRRKEQAAKRKRTLALKAKLALKEKVAAEEAKKVAAEEAKKVAAAGPQAAATPKIEEAKAAAAVATPSPSTAAVPTIAVTPSKGLTIQFQGDFAEFCKAANQLVVKSESSSATTVVEKKADPALPVVAATQPATAEAVSSTTFIAPAKVEEAVAASVAPKAASAEKKKTAGRTRTIVPTKKLAEGQVLLAKKTISFTGTFFQMKRAALQELAKKAGAKVVSGIDEQIDYVVIGADAGHKKKIAKKMGVPTVSEKNFISSASI